jgi:uncharacterized protein involved in cysteine biosynthesis
LILSIFFPLAGQIILFWIMAEAMGLAVLSCPAFNHHVPMTLLVKKSLANWTVRGFALMAYALIIIPFGALFFLPGIFIGGTELFNIELKSELVNDQNNAA